MSLAQAQFALLVVTALLQLGILWGKRTQAADVDSEKLKSVGDRLHKLADEVNRLPVTLLGSFMPREVVEQFIKGTEADLARIGKDIDGIWTELSKLRDQMGRGGGGRH